MSDSKIFNDTERRAASLRHQSLVLNEVKRTSEDL